MRVMGSLSLMVQSALVPRAKDEHSNKIYLQD